MGGPCLLIPYFQVGICGPSTRTGSPPILLAGESQCHPCAWHRTATQVCGEAQKEGMQAVPGPVLPDFKI